MLSIYNLDGLPNEPAVCDLPKGEHIIGRGHLLKCDDKRVSRNHALIKISDDSATITSTHQNPCFYQSANSKTIIILPKDSPVDISNDDKFGLFPDQFWFKCHLKVGEFVGNNNTIDTTDNASHQSNTDICNGDEEQPTESQCILEVENNLVQSNCSKRLCDSDASETHAKVAKFGVGDTLNEHTHQDTTEENNILEDNCSTNEYNANKNETDHGSEIFTSYSDNIPQELKIEDEDIKPDAENKHETVNNAESDVLNVIENIDVTEDKNILQTVTSEVEDPDQASGSGTSTNVIDKARRERCWYGTTCYRKNVQHKAEYSHPGNSDYDSDSKDDRPYCPYGPSCYRKNKDHQNEYKHPRNPTKPPRKRKATKAKVNEQNTESSQDDYDYDDPFLDDASSDEYQEESWSEDSDENWDYSQNTNDEDTKALIKEAKRFTRSKK